MRDRDAILAHDLHTVVLMKRHMAGGLEREGGDLEEGEKGVKGVGR